MLAELPAPRAPLPGGAATVGHTASLSDEALVWLIRSGDAAALESLYHRYQPLAFSIAHRVMPNAQVAEEVVQDVFLSIWRHAATYDPRHGAVRPWLTTIIQNRAFDHARRSSHASRSVPLDEAWTVASRFDVFGAAHALLQRDAIWLALLELPDAQRIPIELLFYVDQSYVEIADGLQLPLGTVKSRVRLGLQKMRRILDGQV